MDMFKSEKEKELLIISLIWVLGQLTGSPSCFASHSVVYAVTLFTKSPLTQDLFQSSCVWNLLAFVGVGGERKAGALRAGGTVPTGSQETSSLWIFPLASVSPKKTVLEKSWMDWQFLCQGIYVWTRTCQVCSIHLPRPTDFCGFLSNLTLVYLWVSQLLLSSSVRQITLSPLETNDAF